MPSRWYRVRIVLILVGRMAPVGQDREYMFACMFLFAGIGLVLYYVIARHTLGQK